MNKSNHYLYTTWLQMRDRCNNPNKNTYHYYGGRGIKVCAEWDNFWTFYEDMGDRPEGHTLDRKDNDKGYSKENCRWLSKEGQSNNTSKVSKAKGYHFDKSCNKYAAQISIKGKSTSIGFFDTSEEAHQAYLKAKEQKLQTIY